MDRADWLLAVTGKDDVNLVAAELGEALGGPDLKVVARVNDPRNERTFEALGIRPVSVTRLMSQIIANTAEAFVAVAGSHGTLSEIAFALKRGKRVVSLGSWTPDGDVIVADDPADAVAKVLA